MFPFALPLVLTGATHPASADGDPCCSIVSIDSVNGIVTARDLRTGETFKFEVDSRSLLKTMRVGQKVWKDAGTRKVSVMDGELCCTVIGNTNLDLADSGRQSAEKGSTGVIRNGNTLTLEKGYEATIDRKGKRVRVREFGGDWRPSSTHTCECDSDENAKCAWEAVRKQVHCTSVSGACQNCQVYETTKVGTDKAQDESSPGTSTSPVTSTSSRTDPGRTLVSSPVGWELKPSADMKGSSGQIVIQFPGMEESGNNFVAAFEVGGKERITPSTYGRANFPLLDGEYDVEINSVRLTRVPVKRGMDTRIHIGTIRFTVPSNVSVEVDDITQKKRLCLAYGLMKCGVPSGEYYIKVGGSSKKMTISDGQVIDFSKDR